MIDAYATPPPPPPRLKAPFTHVVYLYNDVQLSKKHLGSGGGVSLKKPERHQFHLFNDEHHNFKYIAYAWQKEYCKVLETKGIYILNNLVLLLL